MSTGTLAGDHKAVRSRASSTPGVEVLLNVVVGAVLIALPWAYSKAIYESELSELSPEYLRHLFLNWACNVFAVIAASRVKGSASTRVAKMLYAVVFAHGLLAFGLLAGRDYFSRPLMLVAASASVTIAGASLWARSRLRGNPVAIVGPAGGELGLWIRSIADVVEHPQQDLRPYDTVVVNLSEELSAEWTSALARAMLAGCEIRHVAEYLEEQRGRASVEHFHVDHVSDRGPIYQVGKRLLDVAIVIFFLPLALTILALAALGSLLLMGRPVFFVQERVGYGGRTFRMWKLRTMRQPRPGEVFGETRPGDDRIPPFGRLLRRLRIDELPQLWNVLVGDMSLVGPRPEAADFHRAYLKELPEYAYRNLVRPGITGWAQVCTRPSANVQEARNKLSYDLYYVKKVSLLLDLRIFVRTFWILASGAGVR